MFTRGERAYGIGAADGAELIVGDDEGDTDG